jgi:hypothetical protein
VERGDFRDRMLLRRERLSRKNGRRGQKFFRTGRIDRVAEKRQPRRSRQTPGRASSSRLLFKRFKDLPESLRVN